MFKNWFAKRAPRSSERNLSFRPQLEYLEGRLAPSAVMPMDHGHGNGNGHGNGPPGHVNVHNNNNGNVHINNHDSFNTTITDSFNTAINNITVNNYFGGSASGMPGQSVDAILLQAMQQDFSALIGLATDEIALAQETIFALEGGLAGMTTDLTNSMHNLQNSIMTNPLESTSSGAAAGSIFFNMAINQYVNVNHSPGANVTVTA